MCALKLPEALLPYFITQFQYLVLVPQQTNDKRLAALSSSRATSGFEATC